MQILGGKCSSTRSFWNSRYLLASFPYLVLEWGYYFHTWSIIYVMDESDSSTPNEGCDSTWWEALFLVFWVGPGDEASLLYSRCWTLSMVKIRCVMLPWWWCWYRYGLVHGSRCLYRQWGEVYASLSVIWSLSVILFDCHDFKLLIDMKFITVSL